MDKWLNVWLLAGLILVSCKTSEMVTSSIEDGQDADLSMLNMQSPWTDFQATKTREFDLTHVKVNLELDLDKPALIGKATLVLTPYYFDQDVVTIDAKDMNILSLSIDESSWHEYEYDGSVIVVDLPLTFVKGEQCIIEIGYEINQFALPAHASSRDEGGIFVIDYWPDRPFQIWTQGETGYTSTWYPTLDQPNERYTQEISIKVPDSLQTLSNGNLVSQTQSDDGWRTDTWKLDKPHAPYLSALVIGQFDTYPLTSETVKGKVFIEKGLDPSIANVFDRTEEMINLFEDRFGVPFSWPVYNQVVTRDFISGAMENTGAVVFMEDLLTDAKGQELQHYDDVISHELAHHWFGNLVTCESWANLPLNESFASYSEQIWNEYYYGQDSADLFAFAELNDYLDESLTKKADLIRYYYDNADADLFDRHSYSKGSRILHMLRLYLGDDAFFESLKFYLKKHQFKSVEVHDLRLAFEEVTGLDLNWFFTQWFLNPGHPELKVVHTLENDTLYIEVEQMQDLTEYPLYHLLLYVDVNWTDEQLSYPATIANQRHLFRIPAMGRNLKSIIFDSDYQLVGTITHEKSANELVNQIKDAGQVIGRFEAYIKLLSERFGEDEHHQAIDLIFEEEHPMFLTQLLDRISYLEEETITPHAEQILTLINHPSIHVRGSALQLAGLFFPDKVDWKVILNDDHPYIIGIAIENLVLAGDNSVKSLIDSYKDSHSPEILLPLSYAINDSGEKGFGDWYQTKVMGVISSYQLYLLSAYNEYLLSAPQLELLQARDFLVRYAMFHENRDTRLTAFEGLIILSEKVDVSRVLKDVIELEQDEELLEIYQNFMP